MGKELIFYFNVADGEALGDAWLINPSGFYDEPKMFLTKFSDESQAKRMRFARYGNESDLMLEWFFTPRAGHFFRVGLMPRELTTAQSQAVSEISRNLCEVWEQPEWVEKYGLLARIDSTWLLGGGVNRGSKEIWDPDHEFVDFKTGIRDEDWSDQELTFLMKIAGWIEPMKEIGRVVELDPQWHKVRILNKNGQGKIYSLDYRSVKKIHDALYQARIREGLPGTF